MEIFEIISNLPYSEIAIVGGFATIMLAIIGKINENELSINSSFVVGLAGAISCLLGIYFGDWPPNYWLFILSGPICIVAAGLKKIKTDKLKIELTEKRKNILYVVGFLFLLIGFLGQWYTSEQISNNSSAVLSDIKPTTTKTLTPTIIATSMPPDSTKTPTIANPTETMSPNNTPTAIATPATATTETDATTGYRITHSVMTSGGNLRNGPSYRVGDTIGESTASGSSLLTSSSYNLNSGFWTNMTDTVPMINPTEGDSN